jgi:hypothetical protein
MPNQDGTGPQGKGPMTGRGMGRCGGGQWRGKGMGKGFGRRMGRCCESLEDYRNNLKKELEEVEKEIGLTDKKQE